MYLASRTLKKRLPDDLFTLRGPLEDPPEWRLRSSKALPGAKKTHLERPGTPQRSPRRSQGPLDHPYEFHPCNIIFENLRFSSFTRMSNVFSMFFDYHSCFLPNNNISEIPPLDAREPLWDPSRASEFKKCMGARVAHTAGTEAQN